MWPFLASLHWLPVSFRIDFKIHLITCPCPCLVWHLLGVPHFRTLSFFPITFITLFYVFTALCVFEKYYKSYYYYYYRGILGVFIHSVGFFHHCCADVTSWSEYQGTTWSSNFTKLKLFSFIGNHVLRPAHHHSHYCGNSGSKVVYSALHLIQPGSLCNNPMPVQYYALYMQSGQWEIQVVDGHVTFNICAEEWCSHIPSQLCNNVVFFF